VFVVGYLGDWRCAAAVLFERHSLQGHPAPSREKRQGVAASTGAGAASRSWPADISSTLDTTFGTKQGLENQHINAGCPMFVPAQAIGFESSRRDGVRLYDGISNTLQAFAGTGGGNSPMVAQPIALAENTIGRQPQNGGNGDGFTDGGPMYTLNATGVHGVAQPIAYAFDSLSSNSMKSANPISGCNEVDVSKTLDTSRGLDPSCNQGGIGVAQPIAFTTEQTPKYNHDQALTLTKQSPTGGGQPQCVAQPIAVGTDLYNGNITGDVAATMGTPGSSINASGPTVLQSMAVRRLTPVECERLQGFGDNYTDIKSKNKPTPDGPRYKALGNSMAVPVMAWIGQRIEQVEAICKQNK
jgi:DNA (cytosine-5)-methyltransferase 1